MNSIVWIECDDNSFINAAHVNNLSINCTGDTYDVTAYLAEMHKVIAVGTRDGMNAVVSLVVYCTSNGENFYQNHIPPTDSMFRDDVNGLSFLRKE